MSTSTSPQTGRTSDPYATSGADESAAEGAFVLNTSGGGDLAGGRREE